LIERLNQVEDEYRKEMKLRTFIRDLHKLTTPIEWKNSELNEIQAGCKILNNVKRTAVKTMLIIMKKM
jgi:hypothetical protein